MFKPRPMQQKVMDYRGGKMGVSAVPGSGKTQTLSALAARLITNNQIEDDQEILIVTLVNSAVNNFSTRIASMLKEAGMLPDIGYRVRTLHGLAHDIVRERPDLVGLSENFQIADEREADTILKNAAQNWLHLHPEFTDFYRDPASSSADQPKRKRDWEELVVDIARAFVRQSKNEQVTPGLLRQMLDGLKSSTPLLEMGCEIYADYQQSLNYRGEVDFDDLIRLALQAINSDVDYLNRLRARWPYILEDEAQDSSLLQENILRRLTGDSGNWVRVGDPNQAIFETFTTADPKYLLNFMKEPGSEARNLPNSGRSTRSIIRLANHLVDWTRTDHPYEELRDALTLPLIEPTPPGDPQPNPPNHPDKVFIIPNKYQAEQELEKVVKSVEKWLPEHPNETIALLVPRNERGAKLVELLKKNHLKYVELLQTSQSTRHTSGLISAILQTLAEPGISAKLADMYRALRAPELEKQEIQPIILSVENLIRKCQRLEDYLYPGPELDWLNDLQSQGTPEEVLQELVDIRNIVIRWQNATLLPVDQLILTISQDLFTEPSDLALAHKLALVLEYSARSHPEWTLPDFCQELDMIAQNRRKLFQGFGEEENGFDPDQHKGEVVVATIHKAKGLEWDRVHLLSVNNYDFPSAEQGDSYISEKWFVRDHLNLPDEVLAQLNSLIKGDIPGIFMEEGVATSESRLKYARERLRLLFVGITRARKELVITWNAGKYGDKKAALPVDELYRFWENEGHDTAKKPSN